MTRSDAAPRSISRAITRRVSASIGLCELSFMGRQAIDLDRARLQHAAYVAALESMGVAVTVLPEESALPDAVFVEDTAVVLDEIAVLCRPGAESRRPEIDSIAPVLGQFRAIQKIEPPGTVDGGDVLVHGTVLFVGRSSRTNDAGIRQVRDIVEPFGFRVVPVALKGCLHLKSAVTAAAPELLLVNPEWLDLSVFRGYRLMRTAPEEPWAANVLAVNGKVLASTQAPRTADLMRRDGLDVAMVDVSELHKAEAALTCLSLLFR